MLDEMKKWDDEEFVVIPDFESYVVSNYGRIISLRSGKEMERHYLRKNGKKACARVRLTDEYGCRRGMSIGKLVYEIFGDEWEPGKLVYTIDRDPSNLHISNLTQKRSLRYRTKLNLSKEDQYRLVEWRTSWRQAS